MFAVFLDKMSHCFTVFNKILLHILILVLNTGSFKKIFFIETLMVADLISSI